MFRRPQLVISTICVVTIVSLLILSFDSHHNMYMPISTSSMNDTNPILVYTERQKRLRDTCLIHPVGSLRRILSHDAYRISYCAVPKAGCTFWINVFRFLHNETNGIKVNSPHEIPRMITHYGKREKMKYYNLTTAEKFLPYTFRFLFTRNPYSRLWSAYVDKFLLPDYWWTVGQRIVTRRPNHTSGQKHCANDITFAEFLEHITKSKIEGLNEHWCPVSYMCDPCRFRPDVIGTMETFTKDSHFILSEVNLEHLMDNYHRQSHTEEEMAMLIKYNFNLLNSEFFQRCSNKTDMVKRLWKTFQINGYLPMNAMLPIENWQITNATTFTNIVQTIYRKKQRSSAQSKLQRRKALQAAFRTVPPKIMEKIKTIYIVDFTMFNYDPNPSWLTSNLND